MDKHFFDYKLLAGPKIALPWKRVRYCVDVPEDANSQRAKDTTPNKMCAYKQLIAYVVPSVRGMCTRAALGLL